MPEGPFGVPRITGIGPLVTDRSPSGWEWEEKDVLKDARARGPDEPWDIAPELAHHIWRLTVDSDHVHFGPEPTLVLEGRMMFFPDKAPSFHLNNWIFTRLEDKAYTDPLTWEKIPSLLDVQENEVTTEIMYDIDQDPNPFRSKIHSQQYTKHGAMFTYEFEQYANDEVSGFARVPVPKSMSERAKQALHGNGFEYFEYQHRTYTSEFGDPPDDHDEYFHPHFQADNPTSDQLHDFFSTAFNIMERGVRIEE